MIEHFVESHNGGYYTSYLDIETIEEYDEETGDSDTVLASYEEGNVEEAIEAISGCFLDSSIFNKEIFENRILYFIDNDIPLDEAIKTIKGYVTCDYEFNKETIRFLAENGSISQEVCKGIVALFDKDIKEKHEFINKYDYSFVSNNITRTRKDT